MCSGVGMVGKEVIEFEIPPVLSGCHMCQSNLYYTCSKGSQRPWADIRFGDTVVGERHERIFQGAHEPIKWKNRTSAMSTAIFPTEKFDGSAGACYS